MDNGVRRGWHVGAIAMAILMLTGGYVMGVENTFCIISWDHLTNVWTDATGHATLANALESDADWIQPQAVNPCAESWGRLIEFSDYYHETLAKALPATQEVPFRQFLSQLACLAIEDAIVPD
jgi:hypothetical protein